MEGLFLTVFSHLRLCVFKVEILERHGFLKRTSMLSGWLLFSQVFPPNLCTLLLLNRCHLFSSKITHKIGDQWARGRILKSLVEGARKGAVSAEHTRILCCRGCSGKEGVFSEAALSHVWKQNGWVETGVRLGQWRVRVSPVQLSQRRKKISECITRSKSRFSARFDGRGSKSST